MPICLRPRINSGAAIAGQVEIAADGHGAAITPEALAATSPYLGWKALDQSTQGRGAGWF
jgi:hypothetical protein